MSEDRENGEEAIRKAVESAENVDDAGDDEGLDLRLSKLPLNDYGNAQRLIERFGRDLMYIHGPGWFAWDGKRWREDRSAGKQAVGMKAIRFAQLTAEAIKDEAKAASRDPKTVARFDDEDDFEDYIDSIRKFSRQSGNAQRIKAMVEMAAPYLERDISELDTHNYLFNVANGTLDLSGEKIVLRKHRREDRLTHLAEVKYDPTASRPIFNHFIGMIMPETSVQTFLQRYYGYCLTGDISEQKLLLCYGKGGNGKSTLNNVLRNVFGSYAIGLQFETLQVDDNRRGKEASPDIAELPGRRLVIAAEPEGTGVRLSTAIIKRFTGGEPIKARKNFGDFFEFQYRFKLTLAFNDKPNVPAQDDGTWRRPLLVEFGTKIPDEMKDKDIDRKLAAESSGVLNWLLDGYLEWREKGLAPPDEILAATAQYRAENDPIGQFLHQRVRPSKTTVRGNELYASYQKWCERNGNRPVSNAKFGRDVKGRGLKWNDSTGYVLYEDIELVGEDGSALTNSTGQGGWDDEHHD